MTEKALWNNKETKAKSLEAADYGWQAETAPFARHV
jgi:hypothetical protein